MPAAGAANGSHNRIATINRLSRENFLLLFCKKRNELKFNGFESHLFISNCVDITIVALHVMITIILQKLYEEKKLIHRQFLHIVGNGNI